MSRSRFASFALAACMASASLAMAVVGVGAAIVSAVWRGWRYVFDGGPLAPSAVKSQLIALPRIALVRARIFAARQIKRQTPRVTPAWRMCPSV